MWGKNSFPVKLNLYVIVKQKREYVSKPQKPREYPRLSVNQLAEYVVASSSNKKKSILHDAKYPKDFKALQYTDVRNAARRFFKSGEVSYLDAKAIELAQREPKNENERRHFENSILLLHGLKDLDIQQFKNLDMNFDTPGNGYMEISGVLISINPDVVLGTSTKGIDNFGGIKMAITKGGTKEKVQEMVALVIFQYLSDNIKPEQGKVNPKLCYSFDGASRRLVCCPKSTIERTKEIVVCCEQIAAWWPAIDA